MLRSSVFCLLLCMFISIAAKPFPNEEKLNCGYSSCHEVFENKLNVHLIPHSHDDVGWLKTVDQYYYGTKSGTQFAGVQYIIGSVVDALRSNPDRRFIQVEAAFFHQWWKKQTPFVREAVQELVNNGRLEIVNAAWSMNDEAAAHYHSIIDQFALGLRIINDTLGVCGRPKIGWQIDPFGHSREMGWIFKQLGYEAMFFARLDYRDSKLRHENKDLELLWQTNPNFGNKSNLFTGVLYDFYTTPAYFCWDVLCGDLPIIDDTESPDYNHPDIVDRFAEYVIKGASYFKTNNLLVTMGGDFTYQAAEMFYNNMDKLIEGFKKFRPDINVIYSTPSCYVKAVNDIKNVSYGIKTDDFFPYASGNHSYWTGYFTSRPNSKRFERQGNNILQVTKHLTAFTRHRSNLDFAKNLTLLKEVMGIMQHHDAITGTEKQHVADDYVRLLAKAIKASEAKVSTMVMSLLRKESDDAPRADLNLALGSCLLMNVSECDATNYDRFNVAVYNPLSRRVRHFIRLPVSGNKYKVTGLDGKDIDYDLSPKIREFLDSKHQHSHDLVFESEIPPLGLKYFYIEQQNDLSEVKEPPSNDEKSTQFGNKMAGFEIDSDGFLKSITLNGASLNIKQEFLYYHGANGTNYGEEKRASGAYIFRPANSTPNAVPITDKVTILRTYRGVNIDEVHQQFNDWILQIIRVYKEDNYVEFDWIVGPLDISNYEGIEVVTRFTTELNNYGVFYTDANGRQMIKRNLNHRETYEYTNEEPVAGNYYPITARISIKDVDKNVELAVLNDRAQGGASLHDGEIELMVHRRLLNDDAFGVGEALNEPENGHGVVVRGQHFLTFGDIKADEKSLSSSAQQHDIATRKLLSPWTFVAHNNYTFNQLNEQLNFEFAGIRHNLPDNVQILTLEQWNDNEILLRLEHVFEKDEDINLSRPVQIDLNGLFTLFNISDIYETTLDGNQWLGKNEHLAWNNNGEENGMKMATATSPPLKSLKIELEPMQIRTFIIAVL